ncbi:voltage-gated potassium channel KCNC1-like [Clytia hemisphaerica]|uniref:BTB domain-containing protein n=1 Tax=Clytia hemisphaerica TaxID=252671 RepID=A0A7M5V7B6_9CNID
MVNLLTKLSAPRGTIVHQTSEKGQRKININVGGEKHSPYVSTLQNVPDSPLSWIIRDEFRNDLDYDSVEDVYYFDRHPGIFSAILNYFQTGKLHCPRDVCGPMFQEELNFWGIDETQMEACCWPNYTTHREIQENLKMLHIARKKQHCQQGSEDVTKQHPPLTTDPYRMISSGQAKWHRYQMKIWEVLDEPYSSGLAKMFAYISLFFIVLSIITYSLITIEDVNFKQTPCPTTQELLVNQLANNLTSSNTSVTSCTSRTQGANILHGFEILFALWFTLEIVLRLTFCPDKLDYLKTLSNWVDLFAVIPVYLLLLWTDQSQVLMMLNMIRYLRIFRLFKLLYDLHILGKTLQASINQLLILLIILTVPTIMFSSFVYYSELFGGSEKSKQDFSEIQKGMWWSVITSTTVGYGDIVPESIIGKLVGAAASVIGIIIVSITASVIGCNFEQYYSVAITQLRIPAKNSTAFKEVVKRNTLIAQLRPHGKDVNSSIKSDDSKDSGYGRSPVPPSDSANASPERQQQLTEKNIVVAMDRNGQPNINGTARV